MLGQPPWARLSPSGLAILLLVICAGVTTQDICSSPGLQENGGNDQTPVLYLNASSAQEGEKVLLQCTIDEQFPAKRIVFCKNGQEEFSLKAQNGRLIYALVLNITSRSAGTYTCGYQQRNDSNWVRSSALSAPQTLSMAGATAGEATQDIHSSPAPHARILHTLPIGMVLAVAAVGLILLAAGSCFAIRKGACRGRCPRQQHVDSPQTEDTNYGDIQCEYYLLPWGKPHAPLPMKILCKPPFSHTTSFPTGTYKIPACSSRPGFSPAPHVLLLPCMQSACGCWLHKGHGSIPVLIGTKPICLGGPSTAAAAQGFNSPARPLLLSFLQFFYKAISVFL
nr:uncharacterized protein LOC113841232 isoform X1 [Anas platyrhynchos]